ncbi:DegT/DnrJ/EryC1/StrS aminotransferase [Fischerella sp. NIES-3754]|nr:DegT/DnrJ/EryC1/StrS aminotransferase [Fischerella sp. NIES-3754]BCX10656.1 MAG: hypothetical protein KatS3mg066_4515 [Fischerella sp.]
MLVSDDSKLVTKARFLSTQARDRFPYYQHLEIGYNYRLSSVASAIGPWSVACFTTTDCIKTTQLYDLHLCFGKFTRNRIYAGS